MNNTASIVTANSEFMKKHKNRIWFLFVFFLSFTLPNKSTHSFDGTIWVNPTKTPLGLHHEKYFSKIMGHEIGYNLYLPPTYHSQKNKNFPTIYFLHRKLGDESTEARVFADWLRAGRELSAIVIFPNGGRNSKYINAEPGSEMYGRIMIETALTQELVPHIDALFRTIQSPMARSIQGFSMGGMGALRLAFSYPDLFGSVFAFNPAVDDDADNIKEEEPELLSKMLGENPSAWHDRMAKTIGVKNSARLGGLRVEIAIGELDELLPSVLDFSKELKKAGLNHILTLIPRLDHWYRLGPNFSNIPGLKSE